MDLNLEFFGQPLIINLFSLLEKYQHKLAENSTSFPASSQNEPKENQKKKKNEVPEIYADIKCRIVKTLIFRSKVPLC